MKKADLKNCEGCAYNGTECEAFTERPVNCWNNTTKEEAEKREREIQDYNGKKAIKL